MPDEQTPATDAANDSVEESTQEDTQEQAESADTAADGADTDKANADKDRNRQGFQQREIQKKLDALVKENEGYKRRDEERRKAALTEHDRLKEEREQLAKENQELKLDNMRAKIGAELKLPAALHSRLIGTDEESLRADAEDLLKFVARPRAGNTTDPLRDGAGAKRIYTRAELQSDPKLARSPEVQIAAREGRIQ